MEWDINNIDNIVNYINQELSNNRTMVSIEQQDFKVNERVIHKRLIRLGYKKINNQYQLKNDITSNVTTSKVIDNRISNITSNRLYNTITQEVEPTGAIQEIKDIDKLNLLLENLDSILKLIPKGNITSNTSLRTGINDVKSFRIDTGIYKAIKERATRDNITIADILNKALEDYLNNYL